MVAHNGARSARVKRFLLSVRVLRRFIRMNRCRETTCADRVHSNELNLQAGVNSADRVGGRRGNRVGCPLHSNELGVRALHIVQALW